MHRLTRALVALALIVGLALYAGPQPLHPGAAASSPQPRGRLGGSAATFDERFGTAVAFERATRSYRAKGFAAITVTFDKDRAVDIVVLAQRGSSWSVAKAIDVLTQLLPPDAALDPTPHDTDDGRWEFACASRALATTFARSDYRRLKHAGAPGECFALASPDTPSTSGSLEISIGRAGGLGRATPTVPATPVSRATATQQPAAIVASSLPPLALHQD